MNTKKEEFLKRLQAMFKIEAEEHINVLTSGLIELEKNPKDKNYLALTETIFREIHSLKGAARSVDRNDIESICHELESTFSKLKSEEISLNAEHFDLIHNATDTISKLISGTLEKTPDFQRELINQLQLIIEPGNLTPRVQKIESDVIKPSDEDLKETVQAELPEQKSSNFETVRIQTAKLDQLFLQAEQMIQSKISYAQRTMDIKNINAFVETWKTEFRKMENRRFTDSELQLKDFISLTNEKLNELERDLFSLSYVIENDQRYLGRMIDDHVDSMKKVLMLPISTIIEVFPRLVRDIARSQGKEVELKIYGQEIEVDKRILEELKDPLVHLIRNCMDHGLKKPEERVKQNKKAYGTLSINFKIFDGRYLEIIISDDGAGINGDKVISAAIKSGLITHEYAKNISQEETHSLIFKSGISTSPMITDISGRGLGLAIVREKVDKLGGSISVESLTNIGTTFRLILPLTLSTFRGVLIKVTDQNFFIPTVNVVRVLRINSEEIKTVENRETLLINQEVVSLLRLSDVMGLPEKTNSLVSKKDNKSLSSNFIQVLVIEQDNKRVCFKVDDVFDEHQILLKELGRQLKNVRNISGAAVLGSGLVVPVINVSDLMKSALNASSAKGTWKNEPQKMTKVYNILVVDDSITSRSLIKNIIESAGYDVITAIDGVDAFTKAFVGDFDLIVSDVDMPRMNGFELTAKIRKEKKLCEIPVVLVTALDSREDREHGVDVGADAYIVKSSFDQSNLLDVISKLL